MARSKVTDLGLTDVYETEQSSRTGDETYSPSGSKAATGFEDEDDDFEILEDDQEPAPKARPAANRLINFVA
jgi:hypothetical protein